MIGMSNALYGSNSAPFRTDDIKTIKLTSGQGIDNGSMCKVMSRDITKDSCDMPLEGNSTTDFVDNISDAANHVYLGAIGRPRLIKLKESDKPKSGTYQYKAFIGATSAPTAKLAAANGASQAAGSYLYSATWDANNASLSWINDLCTGASTAADHQPNYLSSLMCWAWGEEYLIDENFSLMAGQYSGTVSAASVAKVDKKGTSWKSPGELLLISTELEEGKSTVADRDFFCGYNAATNPAYKPSGRPIICPFSEKIGMVNKVTRTDGSIKTVTYKDENDSNKENGWFLCKEYTFLLGYACYDGGFKVQSRPFRVVLSGDIGYKLKFEDTKNLKDDPIFIGLNQASITTNLEKVLTEYGLVFVEGQTKYTGYEDYGNVRHSYTINVFRDEDLQRDNCYNIQHSFSILDNTNYLSEDEITHFSYIMNKNSDMLKFLESGKKDETVEVAGSYVSSRTPYSEIFEKTIFEAELAFSEKNGLDAVTTAEMEPFYGHYAFFSNVEKREVLFLTTTSTNHAEYKYAHLKLDKAGRVWTTNEVSVIPKIDSSIAKIAPGVLGTVYGKNGSNYQIMNSQKLPLVTEYYNNLNFDNVIRTQDGLHSLAIFPYYYYDFAVNWSQDEEKDSTIEITIKSLVNENSLADLIITNSNRYKNNAGNFPTVTSTAMTIPNSNLSYSTTVTTQLFSRDWCLATGTYLSPYCYNSKATSGARVPFLFKLSNTAYLMSYIAPLCGYPGSVPIFTGAYTGVVTKIINVIEEFPRVFSANRYAYTSSGTNTNFPATVTALNVQKAKPLAFTEFTNSQHYIQMHITSHDATNFVSSSRKIIQPLQNGIKNLWVYPITSTLKYSEENSCQRAILYGVAANGTSDWGSAASNTGLVKDDENKIKLYVFDTNTEVNIKK